jgi:hypothetical protein
MNLHARLAALERHQPPPARVLDAGTFAAAMAAITEGHPPEQAAELKARTLEAYRAIEPRSAQNPFGLSKLTDAQLDDLERLAQHLEGGAA